jgi:hypothetical protein
MYNIENQTVVRPRGPQLPLTATNSTDALTSLCTDPALHPHTFWQPAPLQKQLPQTGEFPSDTACFPVEHHSAYGSGIL